MNAPLAVRPEPLFSREQINNMALPEVMVNLKDQYDRAEQIERRYEGVITSADDELQVKRHLQTVDELTEYKSKLEEALERKQRVRSGAEELARPGADIGQLRARSPIP